MSRETRKKVFACMCALLLINVHHIRAVLLSEADDATEALLRELQVSVEEDMQRKDRQGDDWLPGFDWYNRGAPPTCDDMRTSFENQVTSAKSAWAEIKVKLEKANVFELVGLAKKIKDMHKTMEKGSKENCSWVFCGVNFEVKTSDCGNSFADLRELMNDARKELPCNKQFEETYPEKGLESIGILFGDCTTTSPLDTAKEAAVAHVDTSLAVVGKGAKSLMDVTAHSTDGESTAIGFFSVFFFLIFAATLAVLWIACVVAGSLGFLGIFGCTLGKIRSLFGGQSVSFFDCWADWYSKVKSSTICGVAALASVVPFIPAIR